ncbi:MAG: hypothetical protein M1369_03790 [Deinococcus sp.]|nr:hypothetical protein [Deinococcus sp.]MCL5964891.1 hypothetical protein [Deinococcus sp.]
MNGSFRARVFPGCGPASTLGRWRSWWRAKRSSTGRGRGVAASFAPLLTDSLAVVLAFLIAGSLPAWALAGLAPSGPGEFDRRFKPAGDT